MSKNTTEQKPEMTPAERAAILEQHVLGAIQWKLDAAEKSAARALELIAGYHGFAQALISYGNEALESEWEQKILGKVMEAVKEGKAGGIDVVDVLQAQHDWLMDGLLDNYLSGFALSMNDRDGMRGIVSQAGTKKVREAAKFLKEMIAAFRVMEKAQ